MNTEAEAAILERESRAVNETITEEIEETSVLHEQPLSQDTWKETLKNTVTVVRTKTNRDDILSIARKSLNMLEEKSK
jgi:hypothetical protein